MMKKKLLPLALALTFVIVLIALATVFLYRALDSKSASADPGTRAVESVGEVTSKKLTAEEVKKLTFVIEGMITNLKGSRSAVKASFAFELSNEEGFKEFENYDKRVRSIINQTLADLTSEELSGSKGQDFLATLLINKINTFLEEGKIMQINITELIVQ
ncbi:MAG: flagellar basal body-associated FliL family protein [Gorillibacterium sp.]|nr:flagellar basal body-associated FliL family protein [Gorillibacterium sp.]